MVCNKCGLEAEPIKIPRPDIIHDAGNMGMAARYPHQTCGVVTARNNREVVTLDIAGILQTTRRGVKVTVQATGKALWLPRSHVDFMPGRVIIPT